MTRSVLVCFLIALSLPATAGQKPALNTDRRGLAVRGYDVVAYVTLARPVEGRAEHQVRWNGATWRFATAAHREAFSREPGRYAPQFGGYCAYAVSRNYTADADPHAWKIVDGRLYLNYSRRAQEKWLEDVAGNIAKGRANWPAVLSR